MFGPCVVNTVVVRGRACQRTWTLWGVWTTQALVDVRWRTACFALLVVVVIVIRTASCKVEDSTNDSAVNEDIREFESGRRTFEAVRHGILTATGKRCMSTTISSRLGESPRRLYLRAWSSGLNADREHRPCSCTVLFLRQTSHAPVHPKLSWCWAILHGGEVDQSTIRSVIFVSLTPVT